MMSIRHSFACNCARCQAGRQLDRTDAAIADAAIAVARLAVPLPDDYPRDPEPLGPPCPMCGRPLVVDVALHPTDAGTLIGVARGFKPCGCQA